MNLESRINALRGVEPARVVTAPQLFVTPSHIADQMVGYLNIKQGDRVLEPSAGTGNLLRALNNKIEFEYGNIQAVEISHQLRNDLEKSFSGLFVSDCDFLEWYPKGDPDLFEGIIMNPPFKNGEDIKHIKHALNFLNEGGTLVAICANGPRQHDQLMDLCDHWEDLPAGTFKGEGTNVNTALLVIKV